jgi:hypothetical protein
LGSENEGAVVMKKKHVMMAAEAVEKTWDFNMGRACNCIAGHAYELATGSEPELDWGKTKFVAQRYLGLTDKETKKLFTPKFLNEFDDRRVDKDLAARVLRRFANTGKIIWR